MALMDEMRALLDTRAQHVEAIAKIDAFLAEVRMALNTRQPLGSSLPGERGRPDESSDAIRQVLAVREPMNSAELRKATHIKKTTLEAALKRMSAAGEIVRQPAEWRGPNGNYRYARNPDVFASELSQADDAVDPHASDPGKLTTRA